MHEVKRGRARGRAQRAQAHRGNVLLDLLPLTARQVVATCDVADESPLLGALRWMGQMSLTLCKIRQQGVRVVDGGLFGRPLGSLSFVRRAVRHFGCRQGRLQGVSTVHVVHPRCDRGRGCARLVRLVLFVALCVVVPAGSTRIIQACANHSGRNSFVRCALTSPARGVSRPAAPR